MKAFRRAIAGVTLVLAAILLIGAAAPYLVDGRTIRDQLVAKLSAWADGELRVEGEVRLTSLFDLSIEAENVRIDSPARFSKVSRIDADLVSARLSIWDLLNGRVVFGKVWVDRPVIELRAPLPNVTPETLWRPLLLDKPATFGRLAEAAATAPFVEMELNNGEVIAPSAEPATPGDIERFSFLVERRSGDSPLIQAEGQVVWRGVPVDVMVARSPFAPAGPTREARLRMDIARPDAGALSVDGRIIRANGARFTGEMNVRGAPIKSLADWFALPEGDALSRARYTASAALEASETKISLQQLDLRIGETRASGLLNLALDGDKPSLSGTLGLSAVDLRGLSLTGHHDGVLLPEDPRSLRRGGASRQARRLGAWLDSFEADLRLSADSLRFDGLTTAETAAFLSVGDGVAKLDVAELMVFDGMMNGQFSVRWRDDEFRLTGKGNAAGVDLRPLLAMAHAPQLASGKADIAFGIEGAGPTLAMAARTTRLNGHLRALQGGDLALDVAEMAARARDGALAASGGQDAIEMAQARADYEMLRASFFLKGRDLRLAPVELAQDGWIIRGGGRADLATQRLNWRLDAAPLSAGETQANLAGTPGSSGAAQAVSLHVTGTLQRPWVSYETSQLPLSSIGGNHSWWR